jgi:hypothetical protein
VAEYFVSLLYPGEGRANLEDYHQAAMRFLNDGQADATPNTTAFAQLTVGSAAYDTRVRGMVAMLLTLPRFQEQ